MVPEHLRVRAGRGGQRARHDDELIIPLPPHSSPFSISSQLSTPFLPSSLDTGDCFKELLPHFRLVVCERVRVCDSEYTRYEVGGKEYYMKRAKGREGGSRMSVSVLRKEEKEEEGGRKILAAFLPSFPQLHFYSAFPCGSRLLRARGGGHGGQRPRCRFPLLLRTAQAAKGGVGRSVGRWRGLRRRRDPIDSRRHGCRSGLIAHFNIQRSRGRKKARGREPQTWR